ncbi:hypothetical protein FDECE_18023 [Fusarium decemcellulare]|nr:hypothetical protein FDECE_18023 [Fusarium decemcellulare]
MVSANKLGSMALFAIGCLVTSSAAIPFGFALRPLATRGVGGAKAILDLLTIIGIFTPDSDINAWDWKANENMCEVFMKTVDGGHCTVSVECQEGGKKQYENWQNCHVQGREFFNDPRIGEFSVIFTQRDGDEGEGLTNPVLHVKNVGDWKEWDITGMSYAYDKKELCEAGITPINCPNGPYICSWVIGGNTPIQQDRSKRWRCGVPKVGANFPDGIDWPKQWEAEAAAGQK